jgi:hypothetical protein
VCINDTEEQVFFIAKVFTSQEITITLQGNVNEMSVYFDMQSNYTNDDADANSDVKK